MKVDERAVSWLVAAWSAALLIATLATRPLTPVDETRYLAVAWEMHLAGSGWVPHLNGELYGHKPPLLFWLINLGWQVFGVNQWWPRLLTALAALGALASLSALAQRLAPGRGDLRAIALMITASALGWMFFVGAVMFDMLLACAVVFAALNVARAAAGERGAWPWVGVALGVGILAKGPVMLLHTVPLIVLAPWWAVTMNRTSAVEWKSWYRHAALALLLGIAIALAWAIPASVIGGDVFFQQIFWRQSIDRMVTGQYHARPVWFYAQYLPLLLFPWLLFPAAWRALLGLAPALGSLVRAQPSMPARFALAWLLPALIVFSLFRGKQMIYLIPEIPAIALLMAAGLTQLKSAPRRWELAVLAAVIACIAVALAVWIPAPIEPLVSSAEKPLVMLTVAVWIVAAALILGAPRRSTVTAVAAIGTASVLAALGAYAGIGRALADSFDTGPMARAVSEMQRAGLPVAHVGKYHGQFQFAGRLEQPIERIDNADAAFSWADRNPRGSVIIHSKWPLTHPSAQPQVSSQLQGHFVYLWRAPDLRGVSDQWYRAPVDQQGAAGSLGERG